MEFYAKRVNKLVERMTDLKCALRINWVIAEFVVLMFFGLSVVDK